MKILIAIDGSDCSALALRSVSERCWPQGTEFRLITVIEPFYSDYPFGVAYVIDQVYDTQKQLVEEARKFLDENVKTLQAVSGEKSVTQVVFEGSAPESILEEAQRWNADLIVLGSHGRRGIQRFLLGSVAEKVASYATCSVEIVKDKTAKVASKKPEVAAAAHS